MPWSAGTFSRVHDWTADAAGAIDIEASRMDQEDDGFATGINTCLTKDGQNTPTANLPMAGNRHTGVGNGAARTDYVAVNQIQDGDLYVSGSVSGTNTVLGTMTPAITAYTNGMRVLFLPANDNTGAATLNLNSVGAQSITKNGTTALAAGDLAAGVWADLVYDNANTNWILQNPQTVSDGELSSNVALLDANQTFTGTTAVPEATVTAHEAALSIAGSQLTGSIADARLSSNVALKDTLPVFTNGGIEVEGSQPFVTFDETDGGSNQRLWRVLAAAGTWFLTTRTDADAAGANAIEVSRSGTTITEIELNANTLDFNGTVDISGALTIGGNINTGSGSLTTSNDTADEPGFKGAPQNIQDVSYTLVLSDAGKQIYKSAGGAGETITIPANASVAFPIGTIIAIINDGGGDLSIAITTDTLEPYGGTAGTQTLPDNHKAIIEKVTSTLWKYQATG